MPFIIGKKIKMDQVWNDEGKLIPVTFINAGPVVVTQIKTKEKDGYDAVQIGYDNSVKKLSKQIKGHLKDLGMFRILKEFKPLAKDETYARGDVISVDAFSQGDKVRISGISKGKGFQGVVKRHGFHGGPKTHGQKDRHRAPGSIGAGGVQRVVKGKKMAGRMGQDTITLKNIKIVEIDKEKNIIAIKGCLPGNKHRVVLIQK